MEYVKNKIFAKKKALSIAITLLFRIFDPLIIK